MILIYFWPQVALCANIRLPKNCLENTCEVSYGVPGPPTFKNISIPSNDPNDIQTPGCKPDAAAKGAANWARGARRMSRLGKKGAANRSVFAIKRRQTGRLVETMRQILVTQSESQAMAEAANSGWTWKIPIFQASISHSCPQTKKNRSENVPSAFASECVSLWCQELPKSTELVERSQIVIILQNCTVKKGFWWGLWTTLADPK